MILPESSFVDSLMAPVWSCRMLLLLYRPTKNELQTVRIGESGDDQSAQSFGVNIFIFSCRCWLRR
jgi:hypothetical protein